MGVHSHEACSARSLIRMADVAGRRMRRLGMTSRLLTGEPYLNWYQTIWKNMHIYIYNIIIYMYIKESQLFYCFVYVLYNVISWVSPCQVWWTPTWKDWPALGNLSLVELVAKMPVGTSIGGCTGLERLSKFISPRWRSLETSKRGTNLGGKSTRIRWWCTLLSIYLVGWRLLCKPSPDSLLGWIQFYGRSPLDENAWWLLETFSKCVPISSNIFQNRSREIMYDPFCNSRWWRPRIVQGPSDGD